MERRSFLAGAFALVGTALTTNISNAWGLVKRPANAIAKVTSLKSGTSASFTASFKGMSRNVIVTRTSAGKFIVLDRTCTHEGCTVNLTGNRLQCPCHQAEFDSTTGANTVPPHRSPKLGPLRTYKTAVKSGYLIFTS